MRNGRGGRRGGGQWWPWFGLEKDGRSGREHWRHEGNGRGTGLDNQGIPSGQDRCVFQSGGQNGWSIRNWGSLRTIRGGQHKIGLIFGSCAFQLGNSRRGSRSRAKPNGRGHGRRCACRLAQGSPGPGGGLSGNCVALHGGRWHGQWSSARLRGRNHSVGGGLGRPTNLLVCRIGMVGTLTGRC